MKYFTEADLKALLEKAYEEGYDHGVSDSNACHAGDILQAQNAKEQRDECIEKLMKGV